MTFNKEELVQELVALRQLVARDNPDGISIDSLDSIIKITAEAETEVLSLPSLMQSLISAQLQSLKGKPGMPV